MEKISPCPFCDSNNVIIETTHKNADGVASHSVVCNDCGASGSICDSKSTAILYWNDRVARGET